MPKLFQNKYRIKSARLRGYDYAQPGEYFVTICTQNRKHYFGKIIDEEMILNTSGKIVAKCWREIPKRFPFVVLDRFCVMPNHVHGIIMIGDCEDIDKHRDAINLHALRRDAINRVSTGCTGGVTRKYNPMGKKSLGEIIRWFKGRCTFQIHKFNPNFAWQTRFWDRIIDSEEEFYNVQEYIFLNPINWGRDKNRH